MKGNSQDRLEAVIGSEKKELSLDQLAAGTVVVVLLYFGDKNNNNLIVLIEFDGANGLVPVKQLRLPRSPQSSSAFTVQPSLRPPYSSARTITTRLSEAVRICCIRQIRSIQHY